jgi:hypothetical protein
MSSKTRNPNIEIRKQTETRKTEIQDPKLARSEFSVF